MASNTVSPDSRKQAPTVQNNTAACPPVSVPASDKGLPTRASTYATNARQPHTELGHLSAPSPQCGPCHPAPTLQMTV